MFDSKIFFNEGTLFIDLRGVCSEQEISFVEKSVFDINSNAIKKIVIQALDLKKIDSTISAFIFTLITVYSEKGIEIDYNEIPLSLKKLIELALLDEKFPKNKKKHTFSFLEILGNFVLQQYLSLKKSFLFFTEFYKSFLKFVLGKSNVRSINFWDIFEDCSYKAVGIILLVSFLVGFILAFVGAVQLKVFGAQIYVASLVTIAMNRIMGAIMVGIVMAGRTGASFASSLGTMNVNEEIEALKTFGISPITFLVLPRFLALIISLPCLTLLADFTGILGGGIMSILMLDISYQEYIVYTQKSFNMSHFWIGIVHAFVFAWIISLVGCYYGLTCDKDAAGVGTATTNSVVVSIVLMIVATGIMTFFLTLIGI